MPHIDPERLALFALGEPGATPEESGHLADCAVCVDELAALRHAAVAGRASFDVGELESPPEAVWERIAAELSLGSTAAKTDVAEAAPAAAAAPTAETAVRPKRTALRIWALAASFVLLAGIGLGVWAITQRVSLTEVAEATLAAFPEHPDAEGTAIVEERSDGSLELRLRLSADAAPDTVREVWLDHRRRVGAGQSRADRRARADVRHPGRRRPARLRAGRRVAGAGGRQPRSLRRLDRTGRAQLPVSLAASGLRVRPGATPRAADPAWCRRTSPSRRRRGTSARSLHRRSRRSSRGSR